jgi:hypothetical protein
MGFEFLKKAQGLRLVQALGVVHKHICTEVNIIADNLVGTFTGEDDLIAGIAGAAQQEFRYSVTVLEDGFGVLDCFSEFSAMRDCLIGIGQNFAAANSAISRAISPSS